MNEKELHVAKLSLIKYRKGGIRKSSVVGKEKGNKMQLSSGQIRSGNVRKRVKKENSVRQAEPYRVKKRISFQRSYTCTGPTE